MSTQEPLFYVEYIALNSEQQKFVRNALSVLFSIDAIRLDNARAKKQDPHFTDSDYSIRQARVLMQYLEHGRDAERGEELERDYFTIAYERGLTTLADTLLAYVQTLVKQHEDHLRSETNSVDELFDDPDFELNFDLTDEEAGEVKDSSHALYAEALTHALQSIERLFPDLYPIIEHELPKMRPRAQEELMESAIEIGSDLRNKRKPRLH